MQKFYWNNSGPVPVSQQAGYTNSDRFREHQTNKQQQHCHNYQTLTLAINSNNSSPDCNQSNYHHPNNNRRTIKTNEALTIKNNDNEFIAQNATYSRGESYSDTHNLQSQNSEIKNNTGAKTIHLNSSNDYFIRANGNRQCIQVNQSYLKDAGSNKNLAGSCNKVVLKLGDITGISTEQIQRSCNPTQSRWRYNKTWNENMKGKYRQSIQTAEIFRHDYENVYDNSKPQNDVKTDKKDNSRQTPRSRKKSKHTAGQSGQVVYRSKSCERVAGVIDRLSEKLSISALDTSTSSSCAPTPTPPTPTPSLLHSVAARAIPCVDIKVSGT